MQRGDLLLSMLIPEGGRSEWGIQITVLIQIDGYEGDPFKQE